MINWLKKLFKKNKKSGSSITIDLPDNTGIEIRLIGHGGGGGSGTKTNDMFAGGSGGTMDHGYGGDGIALDKRLCIIKPFSLKQEDINNV